MSALGKQSSFVTRGVYWALKSHSIHFTASRQFSVLSRPPPNYPGHVPLTTLERGALAIGSAFGSLLNPYRAGI